MSIEKNMERIADALEGIKTVLDAAKVTYSGAEAKVDEPKKADAKKETKATAKKPAEAEEPKGPSKEDARKALQDYMAIEGREAAIELLKEHADGAENLSQLKPEYFKAVIDAIKAAGEL